MSVLIWNETEESFSFELEEYAKKSVEAALDYEDFPVKTEVNITIIGEDEMRELNREQRQTDRITDVLSFPLIAYEFSGDYRDLEKDPDNVNPDTGEIMLGDIVLCAERIRQQAEEYGHSELREFCFLIVHSMLHLLGYDHMAPEEETEMFRRQEEILLRMKITRG